jgi:hypothetical protein
MKFGIRVPSLKGRIAARISPARAIRHRLGLKVPRGAGWLTDPERAARNRVYSRVTVDPLSRAGLWLLLVIVAGIAVALIV